MTSDEKQAETDYILRPSFLLYCRGSKNRNGERGKLWGGRLTQTVCWASGATRDRANTHIGTSGLQKALKIKTELEKNKDHSFALKLESGTPGIWCSITRLETLLMLINKHLD